MFRLKLTLATWPYKGLQIALCIAIASGFSHMAYSQDVDIEFEPDETVCERVSDDEYDCDWADETLEPRTKDATLKINQYLAASERQARDGLKLAFDDYKVWFKEYNHRKDPPSIVLIKELMGTLFSVVGIAVPAKSATGKIFRALVVSEAMREIGASSIGTRYGDTDKFLEAMEYEFNDWVLNDQKSNGALSVYAKFRNAPEHGGVIDLYVEEFEKGEHSVFESSELADDELLVSIMDSVGIPRADVSTQILFHQCALFHFIKKTYLKTAKRMATGDWPWHIDGIDDTVRQTIANYKFLEERGYGASTFYEICRDESKF